MYAWSVLELNLTDSCEKIVMAVSWLRFFTTSENELAAFSKLVAGTESL